MLLESALSRSCTFRGVWLESPLIAKQAGRQRQGCVPAANKLCQLCRLEDTTSERERERERESWRVKDKDRAVHKSIHRPIHSCSLVAVP